jgi:hypothetical protein
MQHRASKVNVLILFLFANKILEVLIAQAKAHRSNLQPLVVVVGC